jgi:phosphopantothenoylcysteine synthetase/decarboxylase
VRCITNIFSGRTGAQIASLAFDRGHAVTLLTSHPEVIDSLSLRRERTAPEWSVRIYRTFDDLDVAMGEEITGKRFDTVIHAAAVSDYRSAGIFTLAPNTTFNSTELKWRASVEEPGLVDASLGKVRSSHPELWLRLLPTPKLIDKIRPTWDFQGILVKFKLEVGLSEQVLLEVAERARLHSNADLMVANTLEGMHDWALIGARIDDYQKVPRTDLSRHLLGAVESIARLRQGQ